MTMLKLAAFDEDDLVVISAHLQDAMVRVSDMTYLGENQRFVLACTRLGSGGHFLTGLHFERVIRVRVTHMPPRNSEKMLKLIGMTFIAGDSPSGDIVLLFDDDGAVRLSVECLEVAMADLPPFSA